MARRAPGLVTLNYYEARTAMAIFERLFPADEHGPGATAIGVLSYLDQALGGLIAMRLKPTGLVLRH